MKKPLRQPPSQSTRANPKGVVDIVPRPFSFCKGSGSPCPITPPELETLPHAGPRCAFLGRHRVGGYRGNEIFFMCEILRTLGRPFSANESFFLSAFFGVLVAAKDLSRLGVLSLPCGKRDLPRASTGLCARVCVRLSRMSRNTTSKAVSDRPAFFDGGSRYRPGKGKRLPTFFTPKSFPFCASQHPHSAAFLEEPAEGQHLFLYRN